MQYKTHFRTTEHCCRGCARMPRLCASLPRGVYSRTCRHFAYVDETMPDIKKQFTGPKIDPQGYHCAKSWKNPFSCFYGRPEFAGIARECPGRRYTIGTQKTPLFKNNWLWGLRNSQRKFDKTLIKKNITSNNFIQYCYNVCPLFYALSL